MRYCICEIKDAILPVAISIRALLAMAILRQSGNEQASLEEEKSKVQVCHTRRVGPAFVLNDFIRRSITCIAEKDDCYR